jgi:hypothetical protein
VLAANAGSGQKPHDAFGVSAYRTITRSKIALAKKVSGTGIR